MKNIANLLFEARMLKEIPRSGYHFLGVGKESVAEHCFSTTFIAYVMSRIEPEIDALKLISMCLIHDLPEARTGDLNTVHKKYVKADETKALADAVEGLEAEQSAVHGVGVDEEHVLALGVDAHPTDTEH